MKKSLLLLVMLLVLPLFLQSPTHAALTPYLNTSGTNIVNYGDLYYPNYYDGYHTVANRVGTSLTTDKTHSYFDNFEDVYMSGMNFGPSGHSGVNFSGSVGADSGLNGDGTIYAKAYAGMTYEGFTGGDEDTPGIEAKQQITTTFTQYYYDPDANPNGTTMQISGLLDLSDIIFNVLNTGGVSSIYSISGSVAVNEKAYETAGNAAVFLELSPDNLSDSDYIKIKPGTLGSGYYYEVTTSLTILAVLDNVEVTPAPMTAAAFSGNQFILGDSDNPIMVTASWSAVPVPSSLLLLFSGVAGISFIRRRRS